MKNSHIFVDYPEPHLQRTRQMLASHPEIKTLFGYSPKTALYTLVLVVLQTTFAILLKNTPLWLIFIISYCAGAIVNHALYVIIHECTHNLVFKHPLANRLLALFSNLPQFFPASMSFFKYHLLHHRYQGDLELDADLPGPQEAKWVGNSPIKKSLFLFLFPLVVGVIRPLRLKKVSLWDGWFAANLLLQIIFLTFLFYFWGWKPLLYLFLSTLFGVGLHPLGARWIQEHYVIKPNQETYSYYGPLNKLSFNVGYHNEHHDFIRVPCSRLPRLKLMAPEFYDHLYFHKSWVTLLFKFLFDRKMSLFDRVIRPSPVNIN